MLAPPQRGALRVRLLCNFPVFGSSPVVRGVRGQLAGRIKVEIGCGIFRKMLGVFWRVCGQMLGRILPRLVASAQKGVVRWTKWGGL